MAIPTGDSLILAMVVPMAVIMENRMGIRRTGWSSLKCCAAGRAGCWCAHRRESEKLLRR